MVSRFGRRRYQGSSTITLNKSAIVSSGQRYSSRPSSKRHTSLVVRKGVFGVPTRSNTNRAVQSQKMARGLKFCIYEEEGLYYPCSENKGADQLHGYPFFMPPTLKKWGTYWFRLVRLCVCVYVFMFEISS